MAKNPLDGGDGWIGHAPGMTGADLFDWCIEKNAWAERFNMDRWFFVATNKDTGLKAVQCIDGVLANEVRKFSHGWRPDYMYWPVEKLEDLSRKLAWYVRQGGSRPLMIAHANP